MRFSDSELLEQVSDHTAEIRALAWLKNIRANKEKSGFRLTLKDLKDSYRRKDHKAVIVGAGPGFKKFGVEILEKLAGHDLVIVACDGALPTFSNPRLQPPDFVCSVDAHPVVARFYRAWYYTRSFPFALLSTTVHRDVVNILEDHRTPIYWWQSFPNNDLQLEPWTGGGRMDKFHVKGVPVVQTGGNVGTTSYIIASMVLGCSPIGLLGLEFAWSDETPYSDTQYYSQLMELLGNDTDKVKSHFVKILNKRDGKTYIADPVYYAYALAFREIFAKMPYRVRKNTYNLTKEGILSAPGLKTISLEEFLKL